MSLSVAGGAIWGWLVDFDPSSLKYSYPLQGFVWFAILSLIHMHQTQYSSDPMFFDLFNPPSSLLQTIYFKNIIIDNNTETHSGRPNRYLKP